MSKSLFVDPNEVLKPGKISFQDIPVCAYNRTVQEERANFKDEDLIRIWRDMSVIREFESMLQSIKTLGNYNGNDVFYTGPAHLSLGQEAAHVGQAYLLDKNDYTFGSHRSHGEILAKGLSAIEKCSDQELMEVMENFLGGSTLRAVETMGPCDSVKELAIRFLIYGTMAEIFARETGWHKGMGGSMHAFFLPFGVYPNNAIVGGSATIATGAALYKMINKKPGICVCNMGDGATGRGPFWEALCFATMDQTRLGFEEEVRGGIPVLFNVNNNQYAMGDMPVGETMGWGMSARIGAGVSPTQLHAERVDGYNPLAVIDAYRRKLDILKKKDGPVLLETVCYRFKGHSTGDPGDSYRTQEEIDAWMAVDPFVTYRKKLVEAGVAPDSTFDEIFEEVKDRMTRICRTANDPVISPYADFNKNPGFLADMMFSNETRISMAEEKPYARQPKEEGKRYKDLQKKNRAKIELGAPNSLKNFTLRDALSEPILNKIYEDPTLVIYGEDCGEWGGGYKVFRDMYEVTYPSHQFSTPISEAAIVGTAVGYAVAGGRACIEMMYGDFIGCAGDEIFNQMAKWQSMSAGILKMPIVLRISVGARYGAQHSQEWTSLATHIPGLKVCYPATPYEAKGIMQSALDGTDPVLIFESQRYYDEPEHFHEGGVPAERYSIPIGEPNPIRSGKDITILTVGAPLYRAVEAADELKEKYGMEAEIINLPTLVPLNYEKLVESVKKTGRVLLVSDACVRGSFLNDIAANLTNLCFNYLDAPPAIVGAQNWITPPFEFDKYFFPGKEWILDAINQDLIPLPNYVPVTAGSSVERMRKLKEGV